MSLDQRRIREEYEWRSQLKEGDRIDTIFTRQVGTNRVSQWTRATITQVLDSDNLFISFDNEHQMYNRLVNRFNSDIAMFNKFTDDLDWKYEIRTGDIIDSLDGESIWYKSTCLNTREVNLAPLIDDPYQPDRIGIEAYIAYRYYDEEEGHK